MGHEELLAELEKGLRQIREIVSRTGCS
jgi:hypothetical protein